MPEADVDVLVVGAGVVGLAVARAAAARGLDVLVLEREPMPGQGTSSRNSEVVHGGIYYRPGSLKAELCALGREATYAYCAARGIQHRRTGKYIVATRDEEVPVLERYCANGRAIGARDLELVGRERLRAAEPAVEAVAALWSPHTGIVCSHSLVGALRADVEAAGGAVLCGCEVVAVERGAGAWTARVAQGGLASTVSARYVVNAAGHGAPTLAARTAGMPAHLVPTPRYARGRYYTLRGPVPFRHLVYPVAEAGGLGVHVTLDLAGRARFGPDVEWIEAEDYTFDEGVRERFVAAIRRYWPDVDADRLSPGYTGVRPKVAWGEALADDFILQGAETHGLPGIVHLYGIESPGLTAALPLGERAAAACA
jgi:L-2-hydroxyglutarate oxidase LhgO